MPPPGARRPSGTAVPPERGVHRGVDQDRAAGAPPAREALLPAAARRGREAAVGRGAAHPGGGPRPPRGARLPRPGGRAAAHRGADHRGCAAGPRSSGPCCPCCSAGSPTRPSRTPDCSRSARSARPWAIRRGSCGCCATRPRPPSGWPACSPPAGTRPACCCAPPRPSRCSPTTPSWCPKLADALRAEMMAAARRHDGDAEQAAVAVRSLRRRELFRVAAANVLGLIDLARDGRGADRDHDGARLTPSLARHAREDRDGAGRPAADQVRDDRDGPLRRARVRLRQRRRRDLRARPAPRPRRGPATGAASDAAQAVGTELRRLLQLPAPDPPLVVDADLRPEGSRGRWSARSRPAAAYYARRAAAWESQALLRAEFAVGDAALGAGSSPSPTSTATRPAGSPTGGARDPPDQGARRGRAHPPRHRPRPAPQARPRRPVRRGVDRPAPAVAAGATPSTGCAPPEPWPPSTRPSAAAWSTTRTPPR